MPLAGGIVAHGYQCGQLWGATLAAGAQAYRLYGPSSQAEMAAVLAAQKLMASFRARNHDVNCLELTDADWTKSLQVLRFLIKGGAMRCFGMAASFAPVAFGEINAALEEEPKEAPARPLTCAALLAEKMGASDMHTVMAAGFAGGIGLSGGACGALGAAIWIAEMNFAREEGVGKIEYESSRAAAAIDRFIKIADFEFECSKIVGRKFESIEDHASYLREGGCAKIIESLAIHG